MDIAIRFKILERKVNKIKIIIFKKEDYNTIRPQRRKSSRKIYQKRESVKYQKFIK